MTHIAENIIQLPNVDLVYQDIERFREIKQSIAALEVEKKLIEGNLKHNYFDKKDTFEFKGRILATCKPEKRTLFDSTTFKSDHPDMYESYSYESVSNPIRLK